MGYKIVLFVLCAITASRFFDAAAVASKTTEDIFWWKSCGNSSDPVQVQRLQVIRNNSNLHVTGNVKIPFDLKSQIKGSLDVKRNVLNIWIPVPCIDHFGSCSYDDVCKYMLKDDMEFDVDRSPFHCPVSEGSYSFDELINLNSLPSWLEKGLYNIKVVLSMDGDQLICLKMSIHIK